MINVSKERFHFDDEEEVVIQTPKKKAEKKPTPKEMGIEPSKEPKKKIQTKYIVKINFYLKIKEIKEKKSSYLYILVKNTKFQ